MRLRIPNRATSKLYTPTPEVNGLVSLSVNGKAVQPVIEKGYAAIRRDWKAGDKIELELPLKVQRVKAVDEIAATRGQVALRYGPLIYNIEKVDQDIARPLAGNSALAAEWRAGLLGGITVIQGEFADGSKLLAIPNYARANREKDLLPEAGPDIGRSFPVYGVERRSTPTAAGWRAPARIAGSRLDRLDESGLKLCHSPGW